MKNAVGGRKECGEQKCFFFFLEKRRTTEGFEVVEGTKLKKKIGNGIPARAAQAKSRAATQQQMAGQVSSLARYIQDAGLLRWTE
jgi:hypothetical protein